MTSIIKVDTIQDSSGNNIINESSNTITVGASGDTITIPSGATITNNGTATGFGETNSPLFIARKSGDQTGISNATWTKITGWVEISDPDSKFDTSNARFTPAVAGKYFCSLNAWVGTEANTVQYLSIYKNGTAVEKSAVSTGADTNLPYGLTVMVEMDTDDYLEPYVYISGSGATKTVYSSGVENRFSAFLIKT